MNRLTRYVRRVLGTDAILAGIRDLKVQGVIQMATLDETLAAVQQESTIDDSILTLLKNLQDQISNAGLPADAQAKVDTIFGGIQANIAKLSAAVTANTPSA